VDKNPTPLGQFIGKVVFGAIFMIVGLLIVLFSLNIIPSTDESFNAPRWVVALTGLFFIVAGTLPMLQGLKELMVFEPSWLRILNNLIMLGFLSLFAIPFNWVAFGSGSGGFVFIIFAIFIDLLVIYSIVRFLRGDDLTKTGK
jgi:hypothetical protein